MEVAPPF